MLRALTKNNVEVVSWNEDWCDIILQKREQGNFDLFCPNCNGKVIFVNAIDRIKHFRHCISSYHCNYEPESEEHLAMKQKVAHILKKDPLNEKITPEMKKNDQIADIWCKHKSVEFVIECQASHISKQDFDDRRLGWNSKNVYHVWIFGKEYLTKQKRLISRWKNVYFYEKSTDKLYNRFNMIENPIFKPYLTLKGDKSLIIIDKK